MRWVLFAVVLVLMLASLALGVWLGGKSKRVVLITVSTCLVAILTRVVSFQLPLLEYAALPYDWYAIWRPWWVLPFAMCVLGAGTRQMGTRNARILVGVCAATVFGVIAIRLFLTARVDPGSMYGVVRGDGVCQQTTPYTCGASAAATLLHHYGITSTEAEMAELCWTNSLSGTDEFCVARGLRLKLGDRALRPALHRATWDDVVAREAPAMITIKWGILVDHWVVLLEVQDDGAILVGDPLEGVRRYSKADFLATFQGTMVTLEPTT